jgi:hypothetical protein
MSWMNTLEQQPITNKATSTEAKDERPRNVTLVPENVVPRRLRLRETISGGERKGAGGGEVKVGDV